MKNPSKRKSQPPEVDTNLWFPPKRYGYGWGWPVAWQGWAVLLGYIALSILIAVLPVTQSPLVFFPAIASSTGALLWVCYRKGAKPRWSWGDEPED